MWTEIAKFLDGRSLVMLAATSHWFHRVIMEDSIWKYVCLRDLQVPATCHVSFKWIDLYASAFGMDQSLCIIYSCHGIKYSDKFGSEMCKNRLIKHY